MTVVCRLKQYTHDAILAGLSGVRGADLKLYMLLHPNPIQIREGGDKWREIPVCDTNARQIAAVVCRLNQFAQDTI